ncbi:hypothetical protein [Sinomicrobium sp. M5D2P9]
MKNTAILFKVIVAPILCFLCLIFIINDLFYYPLSFGLIIGLVNWDIHKFKPIIGVFLSLLISYITFFMAYYSLVVTQRTFEFLGEDSGKILAVITSAFIIAPLLVFFAYKFIFHIPKTNFTFLIIISSVVILVLGFLYFMNYLDSLPERRDLNKPILNQYSLWQIIMALAIQLIIYQKQVFKLKN